VSRFYAGGTFGAVSTATQALHTAMPVLDQQLTQAMGAAATAESMLDAGTARHVAAKALHAQLNKMDADWFKRVGSSSDNNGTDWALYQKYVNSFPFDPLVQSGLQHDFEAGSDALYNDLQLAWAEMLAAEDALPALRLARSTAKSALTSAQAAIVAANKKYEASVKADEAADRAAAAAVQAKIARQASGGGSSKALMIGAAVLVPLLAIAVVMSRKKSSVAGYRRRSRR